MPPNRKYKRKSNKRTYKRYKTPSIIPDSYVTKLRYVDAITLDPSVATGANHIFRANSLFDPDFTGVGHQPLGYDQFAGVLFDHYTVLGSKISCKFMSAGSGSLTNLAIVGVRLADNTTVTSQFTTLLEQSNNGYKLLTNSNALQGVTVTKGYSPRKFFGIKDIQDNRALLGAATSTNPTEDALFHVHASPTDYTTNPSLINVLVTIEYTVMFTERKSLFQS